MDHKRPKPKCCSPFVTYLYIDLIYDQMNMMSIDEVQDLYDTTLSSLLDKHALRRTAKRRYQPLTPWFDSECAADPKRKSRMLE